MPNTREKPIELISKWDVVNKLIQLENNYNFYKDVWDAQTLYRRICELEIGIGKTQPVAYNLSPTGWIPVTERLPENDQKALCIMRYDGEFRVLRWNYIDYMWNTGIEWFREKDVTHWMPLPEPPKENDYEP